MNDPIRIPRPATPADDKVDAHTETPAVPPHPGPADRPAPGTYALRVALGEHGYQALNRRRQAYGTALGELADLLWRTAREADRLHRKLLRHAAHVRDRLDHALAPSQEPLFAPATGLLQNAGHTTDLHAARLAQQVRQVIVVLESYQAVVRRTKP
ncbi:hypothetical protein ACH437_29850 [Streptomyces xinghaiensis]|uniref:hypothetical protein n=1 Tax=Streptomyces xinghaiensis TaxID=1038928 RepID=UPI0037A02809